MFMKSTPVVNFINIHSNEEPLRGQIPKAQKDGQVVNLFCAFGI